MKLLLRQHVGDARGRKPQEAAPLVLTTGTQCRGLHTSPRTRCAHHAHFAEEKTEAQKDHRAGRRAEVSGGARGLGGREWPGPEPSLPLAHPLPSRILSPIQSNARLERTPLCCHDAPRKPSWPTIAVACHSHGAPRPEAFQNVTEPPRGTLKQNQMRSLPAPAPFPEYLSKPAEK